MNQINHKLSHFWVGFRFGGLASVVFLIALSLVSFQLNATEQPKQYLTFDDINQLEMGSFVLSTGSENQYQLATQLDAQVDISVNGIVAKVVVKQFFQNSGQDWAEGIYVFPLPEDAAVNAFKMEVDGRIIEGIIKEKKQAKAEYEQAKASGQRASLVEQERPNMFTTSIANIPPGETIMVELHYLQILSYDQGEFQLRFPMTMTPRYIPGLPLPETRSTSNEMLQGTDQVPDADRITPPVYAGSDNEVLIHNPITISAKINAGVVLAKLDSLYHPITVERNQHRYELNLQSEKVPMDRDFVLVWQPSLGVEPQAAIFSEEINNEFYSLLMVLPSHDINENRSIPREMIFIIDTSGSMDGTSITQAKASLKMALNRLNTSDRFNVIEFNSNTSQLYTSSVIANKENINDALKFVDGLVANGGTEMYPAIEAALAGDVPEDYLRQVIFITDGSVGNETTLFQLIKNDLGKARLFTVGIGSAPNGYFMRKAAEFGRGTFTYIGSTTEVQEKMKDLFSKLEQPILADLSITWPKNINVDMWPSKIPDLYTGEPILIIAKTDQLVGKVNLAGKVAGSNWLQKLGLAMNEESNGIATLWARKKIEAINDLITLQGESDILRQSVLDLALKHTLVTDYTSFVAIDKTPVRAQHEYLSKQAISNNLPAGSNMAGYPQGATSARMNLLIAMIAVLIIGLMMLANRFRFANSTV